MTDRTDERRRDDPSDTSPEDYSDELFDARGDGPTTGENGGGSPDGGWFHRLRTADSGALIYVRDVLTSVAIVLAIGVFLFAISGVWPPMVAVESGSMEPNMERGDLIFIVDNGRFVPGGAIDTPDGSTGVVPADVAAERGRTTFERPGDVIVFRPNGNTGQTPIIHRAMLWVEGGENWYDRADPGATGGAEDCAALNHCPAPHAGFITKGDNEVTNANYDQASRLSAPVRPEWVVGTAELRVPYLGHVRLLFSGVTVSTPAVEAEPLGTGADDPETTGPETSEAGTSTVGTIKA
ncbi:signal peptidase I [Natronomonas moolapensis 8.8.11]|uniref:Signal peptidase I n=1 Tax=Natronomonas moolapensis (strain DSM 18674 / CECT 7526 / JCM 14361 / 8.8.11) TaxID=268739 RepID=M1XU36_NATM8|nr:S26 family signal peptidase [Natronomonas moolapensis]CCQ38035.1 signal peptidase I [Natronomonas moolapensis 8.8.11]